MLILIEGVSKFDISFRGMNNFATTSTFLLAKWRFGAQAEIAVHDNMTIVCIIVRGKRY